MSLENSSRESPFNNYSNILESPPSPSLIYKQPNPQPKSHLINGLVNRQYFRRLLRLQLVFAFTVLMQLALEYVYFENDLKTDSETYWYLWAQFISGVAICPILIMRHIATNHYDVIRGGSQQNVSWIFINLISCFLMPLPWLNEQTFHFTWKKSGQVFQQYFKVNYLLMILSLVKVAFIISAFLFHSKYMNPRSNRICSMYGQKAGFVFTLKAIFIDYPFMFIITVTAISLAVFTFAFRIAEHQTFNSCPCTIYSNMFWMTAITMATVGFGDYSPATPLGRMLAVICVIWGGLIVSVVVVVNINTFALSRHEASTLLTLKKLQAVAKHRSVAGDYLRQSLWRIWTDYKHKRQTLPSMNQRKFLLKLRLMRRKKDLISTNASKEVDLYQAFQLNFGRTFQNLDILKKNNLEIINHLNENYIFGQTQRRSQIAKTKLVKYNSISANNIE